MYLLGWFQPFALDQDGTDPNEYTLERDAKWVQIADPKKYRSIRSSVHVKPICAHLGTEPFGSVLVYTGPKFCVHFL